MTVIPVQDRMNCSCVKARTHKEVPDFSKADVIARLLNKFTLATLAAMPLEEFKPHYRDVTNGMVRETGYYLSLSEPEKSSFEAYLASRCANCGFAAWIEIRKLAATPREAA